MLDGTKVQLESVTLRKYISAENGGGSNVTVDRDVPSAWETFKLWRISDTEFQFRTLKGEFLVCDKDGRLLAIADSSKMAETFYIERSNNGRIHIKRKKGTYLQVCISIPGIAILTLFEGTPLLQVKSEYELMDGYSEKPEWDDNTATFEMVIIENNLHGDFQLSNGYGNDKAAEVLHRHRTTFIAIEDFEFLHRHGINTVRIPIGWWIAFDPNPPAPFVGGSLAALDLAFSWAQDYNMKCIIDLHAAAGSQNGMEHSASRDGSTDWSTSQDHISQSLYVIDFLASRYAKHPALLGIELLNEPSAADVPLDVLVSYYQQGYRIVRKYSSTACIIVCQRIGSADPMELFHATIGTHNLVLDLHYYNLFDNFFTNLSSAGNIQFIFQSRQAQLQALNSANGPLVFVGEWVNEWNVTCGSRTDYQDFGKVQIAVYDSASFGWAYWTLKNDKKHWDFEWNILNNYLSIGSSTKGKLVHNLLMLALLFATWI